MGRQSRLRKLKREQGIASKGRERRSNAAELRREEERNRQKAESSDQMTLAARLIAADDAVAKLKAKNYPLRVGMPDLPDRIKKLPVDVRGYPVPWFVAFSEAGEPEFRIADGAKRDFAAAKRLCWVCGDPMGKENWHFVIGPMCSVNRVSAEPGCHRECAEFSVKACPFLIKPQKERREGNFKVDESKAGCDGHMIARNPGAMAVWETRNPHLFPDGRGGFLFNVGDPVRVDWWAQGRPATRSEVEASFDSGLPILEKLCNEDSDPTGSLAELATRVEVARSFLPAESVAEEILRWADDGGPAHHHD